MFDYFYGQQADLFSFYRVPKLLFTEAPFHPISTDAKMLYGILLDRMNLSARNGWLDDRGRVYIIFTLEDIQNALGCSEKKSVKLLDELEHKCGLIERKRRGLGKPNLIYVKNFVATAGQFRIGQKDSSASFQTTAADLSEEQGNDTDISNTEQNHIDLIPSLPWMGADGMADYEACRQYFQKELAIDQLLMQHPYDGEVIRCILDLIVETVCSSRTRIRIASDDKPAELVRSQFMKLNSEHINYVLSCFKENTTRIRNIRQYLLAAIYNAPLTMQGYYDAQVRHDLTHGV